MSSRAVCSARAMTPSGSSVAAIGPEFYTVVLGTSAGGQPLHWHAPVPSCDLAPAGRRRTRRPGRARRAGPGRDHGGRPGGRRGAAARRRPLHRPDGPRGAAPAACRRCAFGALHADGDGSAGRLALARATLARGSGATVILRWPLAMIAADELTSLPAADRAELRGRIASWATLHAAGIADRCYRDPACFNNYKLADAVLNLELVRSGVRSSTPGTRLYDPPALRRRALSWLEAALPAAAPATATVAVPGRRAERATILSDPGHAPARLRLAVHGMGGARDRARRARRRAAAAAADAPCAVGAGRRRGARRRGVVVGARAGPGLVARRHALRGLGGQRAVRRERSRARRPAAAPGRRRARTPSPAACATARCRCCRRATTS